MVISAPTAAVPVSKSTTLNRCIGAALRWTLPIFNVDAVDATLPRHERKINSVGRKR